MWLNDEFTLQKIINNLPILWQPRFGGKNLASKKGALWLVKNCSQQPGSRVMHVGHLQSMTIIILFVISNGLKLTNVFHLAIKL